MPLPAEPAATLADAAQQAGPDRRDGAATGYTIVLPPGWQRIPVRQGTAEAIRKILDQVFGALARAQPRGSLVRQRIELERRLTAMAARAREKAGLDLYLNYAWRSAEHETDVRLFTSCPDLGRLQGAMPDIDDLARVITVVPRTG